MRCQENSFSLFAADDLQRVRAARFQLACQPLNQKKVFGDAKPTKSLSETKSAAYLLKKSRNMDTFRRDDDGALALSSRSFHSQ
ncbi:hypothetical protein GBF38_009276 [Nibea albiflora]|uniref:Uncharacterized protein n=1 Tax=Nibea albiflora TaxID=240163 RepID=A0ACB7EQ57_NIBAL|nr:hypothetical protein GBF38_009276 [Nibea albiflora]